MRALVAVVAALTLTACPENVVRPPIDNPSDAIVVTSVDIGAVADAVRNLCGNVVPGGPCAEGAAISTETKDEAKVQLLRAQEALEAADAMLAAGDEAGADDKMALIEAILRELQRQLPATGGEP